MAIFRATMENANEVRKILTHPDVYRWIADDMSPPSEESMVGEFALSSDSIIVLMDIGVVFIAFPVNGITYDVHTNALPEVRGKKALNSAKEAMQWMFQNTVCQKLTTSVPVINTKARMFASMCGMCVEGINRKSFLKNGELIDQWSMGITKKEWSCQQQQQSR